MAIQYAVSDYIQAPGDPTDDNCVGMKHQAINVCRPEFEIYTFGNRYESYDLQKINIDGLLEMILNVMSSRIYIYI